MSTDVDTRNALVWLANMRDDAPMRSTTRRRASALLAALDRLAAAEAQMYENGANYADAVGQIGKLMDRLAVAEARADECEQRRRADFEHANYIAACAEERVEELHRDVSAAEAQRDTLAEAHKEIVALEPRAGQAAATGISRRALAAVAPTEAKS